MCLTFILEINVVYISPFPGGASVKNLPANAGDIRDTSSYPGLGRSLGVGNGNPLQYSYLENPMYRGASLAIVHEITKLALHCSSITIFFELDSIFASTSEFYTFFQLKNSFSLSYKACLVVINSFSFVCLEIPLSLFQI